MNYELPVEWFDAAFWEYGVVFPRCSEPVLVVVVDPAIRVYGLHGRLR